MATKRPTIYDVAQAAGVSKSLVSLVLQGSPRVGEGSRKAVEAAIVELGYRPSRAAANLAAGRTRVVGVLIDDYTNLWFVDLVRGLHAALGPRGYRLSVVDVATDGQAEDPIDSFLSMRVDGMVVGMDPPRALSGAGLPPIVVAGTRELPEGVAAFDRVANDDAEGGRLVARHLVDLGHRRLGHLAAAGGAARARREAFVAQARDLGAAVAGTDWVGAATDEAGYLGTMELLRADPEITGIFAANDVMAVGALAAAREVGREVPGGLSVVGYDDTSLAASRLVSLTTVNDLSFDVGREAGALLLRRMRGESGPVARIVLPPSMTLRATTATPAVTGSAAAR
ncbi:putative LacI family transcriptional regulator [Gordonia hirsuta DSM 44140 = NBRC 16056]|uniref:Putative LacI family transcriptional regulator n=1 Tax=Gordonia hirsuta DSM 44140 = NBRC 16056 TaxID=1121927 RepID=L7LCI1_9ACTN|nr:LacI family DNA-binding transcriptional regulator [Gordonia hirsuta]GAC57787.1 putative LacI family transcriptional regulator [Gordonia hirsuta DSM 44140 = NBRC 16056]